MKRYPLLLPIILLLCCGANAQSQVERGSARDGVYINRVLGFSFKYPKDWVVHNKATEERIRALGKQKLTNSGAISKETAEVSEKNTQYLLTVFHYPVGTPGITFNPAILVLAENIEYAPGVRNGKDYLLNVRAIIAKVGGQTSLTDPVEYRFGGALFFRDNYTPEVNGRQVAQAYFASIANGNALVFIFLAEDQKSLEEMTKAMETFTSVPRQGVAAPAPHHKPD
jgi:hypothetical protein